MAIEEMQNNGTIDYFLILRQYINEVIKRNYPLTKDDMESIVADTPTENVQKREEAYTVLTETLNEILKEVEDINNQMINLAKRGIFIKPKSVQDEQKDIYDKKQRLLEALWKKQHPEEQLQNKPIDKNQDAKKEQYGRD